MQEADPLLPNNKPLLKVCELSKSFYIHERDKEIKSCSGVSFELFPYQLLALTGPSGAGKSTILKCIYRTYLESSGSIYFLTGDDYKDLTNSRDSEILILRKKEISYVTQFLHCLPRKSAISIVEGPLLEQGMSIADARDCAAGMLRRFHLPERLWEIPPHTFSGGEKQRVNLARGFVINPRLLLLDEPTASLDAVTQEIVVKNILEQKEKGTAIVGVFHDKELTQRVADVEYRIEAP
jgi:alpha-D-ribose 1-methylphosphonate 5-triphosphate synthase subunit PhnL